MNHRIYPALILSLAALGTGACIIVVDDTGDFHANTLRGSGIERVETRDVGSFQGIEIQNGGTDVDVTIGSPQQVTIAADENLIDAITTEVHDGTLRIGMKHGSYSFKSSRKATITVPSLEAVSITGSSDVVVRGIDAPRFKVAISGSGSIRAVGRTDRLDASIAGSGDLELFDLQARSAGVSITGSGEARVSAHESLSASVSGSGDVRYRGDARNVTKSVTGSGSIEAN
jgi:hypothetical protein